MRRDAGSGPGRRSVDGSARRRGQPEPVRTAVPRRHRRARSRPISPARDRSAPRRVASQQAMLSEVTSQLASSSGERPASRQGSQTAAVAARSWPSVSASPTEAPVPGGRGRTAASPGSPCGGRQARPRPAPAAARARRRRTVRRPAPRSAPAPARSPAAPASAAARRVVQAAAELDDPPRRHPEPPDPLGGRQPMQHRLVKLLGAPAPWLMGVVNVTPNSFSDGGRHLAPDAAIAHGRRLLDEGAQILDLGGELDSSRQPPDHQRGGAAAARARGARARAWRCCAVDRHLPCRDGCPLHRAGGTDRQRRLGPAGRSRHGLGRARPGPGAGDDARQGRPLAARDRPAGRLSRRGGGRPIG